MSASHVLVLTGESAEGERGDFYRWTFEGGPIEIATAAVMEALATDEQGDDRLMAALREPGSRWRLGCSCGWQSRWVSSPRSLWMVSMLHLLAASG